MKREIVDTPLLELVARYPTMKEYERNLFKDKLPPVKRIVKEYGSWTKAKELCGQGRHVSAHNPGAPTLLYLIHFVEEDFYKIGITQKSIKTRFAGYPKYRVLDVEALGLDEAKSREKFLKEKYIDGAYTPSNWKEHQKGSTECFIWDETPKLY